MLGYWLIHCSTVSVIVEIVSQTGKEELMVLTFHFLFWVTQLTHYYPG